MALLIGIGYALSTQRQRINWRTIFAAFAVQVAFGGFVLYVPIGQKILAAVSEGFVTLLGYAKEGSAFVFGNLIDQERFDYIFALDVFPVIIYFSAFIAILYYIGVMDLVIKVIGNFLRIVLRGSAIESTAAAAAIFVGNPELTVRPYLKKMSRSELFVVMTAAIASISAEVVAGYVSLGIPAPYIIAASLMTAPGCILFAKLLIPETQKNNLDGRVELAKDDSTNVLEAAARGATDGMFISLNCAAMLIAFLAIVGLINGILGWVGHLISPDLNLSLQMILGKLLKYLTWFMGVPLADTEVAGQFIGIKTITNEFVAYTDFAKQYVVKGDDGFFKAFVGISPLTGTIISIALCGYANLGSIAIYLGSISYLVPQRRAELASFGLQSMVAATLANLMSGTIAGFFFALGGTAVVTGA